MAVGVGTSKASPDFSERGEEVKNHNKMKVPVLPKRLYTLALYSINYGMKYWFVARHGSVVYLLYFCRILMKIQFDFDGLGL